MLLAVCVWYDFRLSDDVLALTFDAATHSKPASRDVARGVRQLARSVSHLLRTVTRVVHVDQSAAAAAVTSRGDDGSAAATTWRLLVKLDNTRCARRCFTSARSAAAFLAVYRARQLDSLNLTAVAGK